MKEGMLIDSGCNLCAAGYSASNGCLASLLNKASEEAEGIIDDDLHAMGL